MSIFDRLSGEVSKGEPINIPDATFVKAASGNPSDYKVECPFYGIDVPECGCQLIVDRVNEKRTKEELIEDHRKVCGHDQ